MFYNYIFIWVLNPFGNHVLMLHNFYETFKSWHLCYIEK